MVRLISEAAKDPLGGIGKPEPLKHKLQGFWSPRISDEHRLVYKVTNASLIIQISLRIKAATVSLLPVTDVRRECSFRQRSLRFCVDRKS
ncbi:MAG TPA: Txe/YoeB family addiction module toxin [Verrucomicrobiae bacterium]|nr:Txe/YoeB family addiction module toxin [Verrucomicrobiae bacterium]